jgi:hypothetical protein
MYTKLRSERYLHLVFAVLLLLTLFAGCSGGNVDIGVQGPTIATPFPPAQTDEAITAYGTITGSGGVNVNNVNYLANNATINVNGEPGTLSDLHQGHVVAIDGEIEGGGGLGVAHRIACDMRVIGPIENLDVGGRQLLVMGQTVWIDDETHFGAGIDPATLDGIGPGSNVAVSGYVDSFGAIAATRIDTTAVDTGLRLSGRVEGLDPANLVFSINRLTVDYGNALVIDLPGGAPADDMNITITGTLSGGLFTAETLTEAPGLSGTTGSRVQAAGMITRFTSLSDFDVDGSPVRTDAATVFLNGDASDLALNAELVLDGDFTPGGIISANLVTLGRALETTTTLTYDLHDFSEISVPTVFHVSVAQGADYSVEIIVDAEASDRVNVTQVGSRLNIALDTGDGNIETLRAVVTMPVLEYLETTSVAYVTLNGFDQAQMTLKVAGVSRLIGSNLSLDNLTATVAGVSRLDLGNIRPIGNATIDISGVSQATLNMDVGSTMTGTVSSGAGSGVSTLFYYGTNVAVDVTTDRLSSIVRLGATKP